MGEGIARRLHPNPSLARIEERVRAWARGLPGDARVLDAGAGDGRYRKHFSTQHYESCDFAQVPGKGYAPLTYVCDLRSIPVADAYFDALLSTQVLAHLPDPLVALREMFRVLRPGGRILLTCPVLFEVNERPYDFYRFTEYGVRHLFEQAGFRVDAIEPVEGSLGALQYFCGKIALTLSVRPSAYGGGWGGWLAALVALPVKPTAALLCVVFTWLELHTRRPLPGMNINWAVTATRT